MNEWSNEARKLQPAQKHSFSQIPQIFTEVSKFRIIRRLATLTNGTESTLCAQTRSLYLTENDTSVATQLMRR